MSSLQPNARVWATHVWFVHSQGHRVMACASDGSWGPHCQVVELDAGGYRSAGVAGAAWEINRYWSTLWLTNGERVVLCQRMEGVDTTCGTPARMPPAAGR